MQYQGFSFYKRIESFRYAINGLRTIYREEPNALIHLVATIVVVILGLVYKISFFEWVAIVFAIGLVWSMELINTAIENLSDFVSPEKREIIKKVKDLSAAAVLIAALTALLIGILILVQRI